MAQGYEFPLKKPPGFHYDFFLLGICTFIAGLIGVPAPNGLIPQAPIHTTSLLVMERSYKKHKDEENGDGKGSEKERFERESNGVVPDGGSSDSTSTDFREVPIAVVEQRVSNLAQGALCLVLLTGPFLHVLNLIPRGRCIIRTIPLLLTIPSQRRTRWPIVCFLYSSTPSFYYLPRA
jgi:hypothetical protein